MGRKPSVVKATVTATGSAATGRRSSMSRRHSKGAHLHLTEEQKEALSQSSRPVPKQDSPRDVKVFVPPPDLMPPPKFREFCQTTRRDNPALREKFFKSPLEAQEKAIATEQKRNNGGGYVKKEGKPAAGPASSGGLSAGAPSSMSAYKPPGGVLGGILSFVSF